MGARWTIEDPIARAASLAAIPIGAMVALIGAIGGHGDVATVGCSLIALAKLARARGSGSCLDEIEARAPFVDEPMPGGPAIAIGRYR